MVQAPDRAEVALGNPSFVWRFGQDRRLNLIRHYAPLEGARILANDAREDLRARGFTDDEIDRWADAFLVEQGSGDLPDFLAWIETQERNS